MDKITASSGMSPAIVQALHAALPTPAVTVGATAVLSLVPMLPLHRSEGAINKEEIKL